MPHSELSLFGDIQRNSSFQVLYLLRFASLRSPALGEIVHMSRHTYATQTCISQGVPIETVSKLMGHSSIQTTQIYAKITNQKVNEDMKKLFTQVNGKYQVLESDITSDIAHKKFPHWLKVKQIFPEKK